MQLNPFKNKTLKKIANAVLSPIKAIGKAIIAPFTSTKEGPPPPAPPPPPPAAPPPAPVAAPVPALAPKAPPPPPSPKVESVQKAMDDAGAAQRRVASRRTTLFSGSDYRGTEDASRELSGEPKKKRGRTLLA